MDGSVGVLVDGLGGLHAFEEVESVVGLVFPVAHEAAWLQTYSSATAVPSSPKNTMFLPPTQQATRLPCVYSWHSFYMFMVIIMIKKHSRSTADLPVQLLDQRIVDGVVRVTNQSLPLPQQPLLI